MHVDDFIFAGNQKFKTEVLDMIKRKYDISKHEHGAFKYIGIKINQTDAGITMNQDQYIQCVKTVQLSAAIPCL